jgi:hypothetical protein
MNDLAYNLFFALCWVIYLLRRVLSVVYGLLEFISKPGSRIIAPIAAVILAYECRPTLHHFLAPFMLAFDPMHRPEPLLLDAVAALGLTLAICAYVLLSRALGVVLGVFPPLGHPLPPLRRLRPKARSLRPVIVSISVPKLPRRRWRHRLMRGTS